MKITRLTLAYLWAIGAACSSAEGERVVGIINDIGIPVGVLSAPDTVTAGRPFTVTVWTFGACARADGAQVSARPDRIIITPFDRIIKPGPNEACIEMRLTREIRVQFPDPGVGILEVRGRRMTPPSEELISVQKEVVVREAP